MGVTGGVGAPKASFEPGPKPVSFLHPFPFQVVFLSMLFFIVPSALFRGLLLSGVFFPCLFCFKNKLKTVSQFVSYSV